MSHRQPAVHTPRSLERDVVILLLSTTTTTTSMTIVVVNITVVTASYSYYLCFTASDGVGA